MAPRVSQTLDVEMIRDGGSFAASFVDERGEPWALLLPIVSGKDGNVQLPKQYSMPVLVDCDPAKRPSNTDTVLYSALSGPRTTISWDDARLILTAIADGTTGDDDLRRSLHFREWLQQMMEIADRDGAAA